MEYDNLPEASGKRFWLIAGYFALMATLMPFAGGLGMMGILIVMGVAAVLLFGVVLIFKLVRRKMKSLGFSKRQWVEMMVGVPPSSSQVVDAEPVAENPLATRKLTTALVPVDEPGLPDRLIEADGLYLSDHFMPNITTLFGQIAFICGVRRYGKSNLLAVLIEEMARYSLPILIVDTDDEYGPLAERRYLSRGFNAGSPDLVDSLPHYLPLRVCDGYVAGRQAIQEHLQIVLNMKSYSSDDEAALVLCELVRGMNDWEQEHPNKERIPVFLYMDEAPKWLPQDSRESVVANATQHYLYKTFFGTVVNRGGKQGWGAVFAAQRIQHLHKAVLQAPWKFLFYQTQRVDLEQYKTYGLRPEDVTTLQRGECYIFSPSVIGFRAFIRERTSPHLGNTPGLEALLAHRQQLKPVEALMFGRAVDMASHEEPLREPEPEEEQGIPVHNGLSRKQQEVLDLYKRGIVAHREIAATLHISESDAYRILVQLDAAGYIQRRKQQAQV